MLFSHRLTDGIDWATALGDDVFARAKRGAFVTAVAAGRWTAGSAFAVVAPVESWGAGETVLCGLRAEVPFDAVDAACAAAGARLLEMSALEGRALAETLRQSAVIEERVQVLAGMGEELAHARDASALLARAAQEVARRMGAGAASIMLVEGDELSLRASVGLPSHVAVGRRQRVGEGIAGWVAASGEKVVLRGRVDDERFRGSDPDARESVVVPLRDGNDVLGVLNVKRPDAPDGFAERHELLDTLAGDIGRAVRAVSAIDQIAGERRRERAIAGMAKAVAAHDVEAALDAALALGHHAVALRDAHGRVLGVRAAEGDSTCRDSALAASAKTSAAGERPGVGFARHDASYREGEAELAQETADTLALLGRELVADRPGTLRVLAVEDHPVMRLGVRAMLEREGFAVAATTATCAEALGVLPEAMPDVVLLDLHLPDATGVEAVHRLREAAPSLPIVVFSVDRSPALVRGVVRAGANGYVTKDAPIARVVAAIRAAAAGLVAIGPDEATAVAAAPTPDPVHPEAERRDTERPHGRDADRPGHEPANGGTEMVPHEPLTPRELELLRYMAEGYTNKELARAMVLAEDTVKKAVQTLIAKLGAADRTHAVVVAIRSRLID